MRFFSLLAVMTLLALPVLAAETAFFSEIQDVPVMRGLRELTDQTLVFDKPEGRIVEAVAAIDTPPSPEIERFYKDTLPQLGWQRIADNSYIREDEVLSLVFESHEGQRFLRVMLRPAAVRTP